MRRCACPNRRPCNREFADRLAREVALGTCSLRLHCRTVVRARAASSSDTRSSQRTVCAWSVSPSHTRSMKTGASPSRGRCSASGPCSSRRRCIASCFPAQASARRAPHPLAQASPPSCPHRPSYARGGDTDFQRCPFWGLRHVYPEVACVWRMCMAYGS
jgi:hypothetical protein